MIVLTKLKELQLFIEAAEMLGGDDWSPTKDQWVKIRKRIMDLKPDEVPPAAITPAHTAAPGVNPNAWVPMEAGPAVPGAGMFGGEAAGPVPSSPAMPMSPSYGGHLPPTMPTDINTPSKVRLGPDGLPDPLTFK